MTCSEVTALYLHIHTALNYGYRPVIIMHGILLSYKTMEDLVILIEEAHPGTEIHNVDAYNYAVSAIIMKIWTFLCFVHRKVLQTCGIRSTVSRK